MFQTARLKLTGWYLLIIMVISVFFSVVIYRVLTSELDHIEALQKARSERFEAAQFFRDLPPEAGIPLRQNLRVYFLDPQFIAEAKERIVVMLLGINGGILVFSTVAGYFLAGKTLRPIQNMMDEQNRFITDASHELRTPLTALRTEVEVAMRNRKLSLTDAQQLLRSNFEEVVRLQRLSDSLILLTQQRKQQKYQRKESVSLLTILENALKKVAPLARKKHIRIENSVKDVILTGDAQSLSELFVILLDNSIKYSKENTSISISSRKSDHRIEIQVKDQGIGIDEEDLPHIFERFYRADSSRSKKAVDGFGLGLSIAKEIVSAHSGSIAAKSRIGKGSTFVITLSLTHQS